MHKEQDMAQVIVGMVMSLDGFVTDRNGDMGPLYPDFEAFLKREHVQEAIRSTGAVVMGRRAYEMANGDFTGYEFQVPIFVLTHHVPERPAKGENENLSFTFVTEGIERAIELAKAAAGEKDVTAVGGAETMRQCIAAGLADIVEIDLRSILLGDGLRLFERSDAPPMELESLGAKESPGVTHLRYRVTR
jgi:dihydrofolate reductase